MSFADVMRRWETLHPYNFTFDLEVATDGLIDAARETQRELLGVDAPIDGGDDDIETELNRAFDGDAVVRIRPHGFTYRHAFWDGVSANLFVHRTLQRASGDVPAPLHRGRAWPRLVLPSVRDLLRMRRVDRRNAPWRHDRVALFDGPCRLTLRPRGDKRNEILIATAVDLRTDGAFIPGVHVGFKVDGRVRRVPSFAHLLSPDYTARQFVISGAVTTPKVDDVVLRVAASTGPLIPIVLVRVRDHCAVTWHEGAFTREEIGAIIAPA